MEEKINAQDLLTQNDNRIIGLLHNRLVKIEMKGREPFTCHIHNFIYAEQYSNYEHRIVGFITGSRDIIITKDMYISIQS